MLIYTDTAGLRMQRATRRVTLPGFNLFILRSVNAMFYIQGRDMLRVDYHTLAISFLESVKPKPFEKSCLNSLRKALRSLPVSSRVLAIIVTSSFKLLHCNEIKVLLWLKWYPILETNSETSITITLTLNKHSPISRVPKTPFFFLPSRNKILHAHNDCSNLW